PAHQMDGRTCRLGLPGDIGLDPPPQLLACYIDVQYPDHRNRAACDDAVPMRGRAIVRRPQSGFLLDFAGSAAGDVDLTMADIVEVGRSRRKIDATRIRGVPAHFAEDEGAVAGAQRAHSESVEHASVGKAPVAPGQEACEIGLEIRRRETLPVENGIARQQDAAVPDRLFARLDGEMRLDLGLPRLRKRPRFWLKSQIERGDAME